MVLEPLQRNDTAEQRQMQSVGAASIGAVSIGAASIEAASAGAASVGVASRTRDDALNGYLPEAFPIATYMRDAFEAPPHADILAVDEDGVPNAFPGGLVHVWNIIAELRVRVCLAGTAMKSAATVGAICMIWSAARFAAYSCHSWRRGSERRGRGAQAG